MSAELDRLAAQLQRSFEGGAWHGPSVLEALKDVTPELAYAHPVSGAHSIWELVLHLGGAYQLVLRRLDGENAQLTPVQDWPPVPTSPSDAAWRGAVRALQELNVQMRDAVRRFDAQALDRPLTPDGEYPAYVHFIGLTQHDLYHAGQIAILKKAWHGRGTARR
jgi:uncharacterized damage-inducible protein DinB